MRQSFCKKPSRRRSGDQIIRPQEIPNEYHESSFFKHLYECNEGEARNYSSFSDDSVSLVTAAFTTIGTNTTRYDTIRYRGKWSSTFDLFNDSIMGLTNPNRSIAWKWPLCFLKPSLDRLRTGLDCAETYPILWPKSDRIRLSKSKTSYVGTFVQLAPS